MTTTAFSQQETQWLASARQMGREAGEVLKKHFRCRNLDIEDKGSAFDIVTEADKGSERIIGYAEDMSIRRYARISPRQ